MGIELSHFFVSKYYHNDRIGEWLDFFFLSTLITYVAVDMKRAYVTEMSIGNTILNL